MINHKKFYINRSCHFLRTSWWNWTSWIARFVWSTRFKRRKRCVLHFVAFKKDFSSNAKLFQVTLAQPVEVVWTELTELLVQREMLEEIVLNHQTSTVVFCWWNTVKVLKFHAVIMVNLNYGKVIHYCTLTVTIMHTTKIWDRQVHVWKHSQQCQLYHVASTTFVITHLGMIDHSGFRQTLMHQWCQLVDVKLSIISHVVSFVKYHKMLSHFTVKPDPFQIVHMAGKDYGKDTVSLWYVHFLFDSIKTSVGFIRFSFFHF